MHIFFFSLFIPSYSRLELQLQLRSGIVITTNLVFSEKKKGRTLSSSTLTNEQEEGTLTKEISDFQNSLSYPPLALERGWESECEWEVEIQEGKIIEWKYLKACSYEIFRVTVEKSLQNWKFSPTLTRRIKIPIAFKIQTRE